MHRLVLSVVFLLAIPKLALADLKTGEDLFLHGDYQGAIKELLRVRGKQAPEAQARLARVYFRIGDYENAEAAAKRASRSRDKDVWADAQTLIAEVHRARGQYDEARKLLDRVTRRHNSLRARVQLGLVHLETGHIDQAQKIFDTFFDDYNNGRINFKDAEQLMYVALAARYMESFQDANDTFRDAVNADKEFLEANVEWGDLFIEKYAVGYAEQSFDEVLKIDPNHPDAHAGMARVKLEQSYDVVGALDHIRKALDANPRHAGALKVQAQIEIDNEQYDDARATLGKILTTNPNDTTARSMLAATYWLSDDKAGFEAEKKKVLAINPKFAQLFHIVADFAVKQHRYQEAIRLEEQALKVDPDYHAALAGIGTGYLRMGEEEKGLEYLNKAFDRDAFNQRSYNILNLYDRLPKEYTFVQSKHFRLRVANDERPILERYLPDLLETAWADMVKRYRFTPSVPVTVEVYADPQDYSVRTIGLPNLGALGVCFGKVITAISPNNGNLNWAMILWHELGHVFAIQLSNSRVPRWFTEGLSEYETIIARPEWRRENDVDVWMALRDGNLPSVTNLNSMFIRAKSMQEMVVAYHLSSLAVEFLATRWGFPKIVEGLKLYGKGKDTPEVIKAMTGLDVPAFDAEFRAHLEKRLAPYKGTFKVLLTRYDDVVALEKEVAARPDDAEAHADLAIGQMVAGKMGEAAGTAKKALTLDKKNKKALFVEAELAFLKRDYARAKKRIGDLIAAGGDGYDARLRLGQIAAFDSDLAEARKQLDLAKQLDPERSEPYGILAALYSKHDKDDEAARELERYVLLEQMEYEPLWRLVQHFQGKKDWAKVRTYGEMALRINPYSADLHLALGEAYIGLRKADDAIFALDSALIVDPPLRRPALAHIGLARAYLGKRDKRRARKAVEAALRLEPRNAEALALQKKVSR